MPALLVVLVSFLLAAPSPSPPVLEVFQEFDGLCALRLWPGFEPRTVAVEVYDGTSTYLYHHPKPPEGFEPLPGRKDLLVFAGKHDSVRANTGTELNGVPTATADLSTGSRSTAAAASLLIHESFHVYQKAAHPAWTANEAELFTYPVADAKLLAQRRLETLALTRALRAKEQSELRCWAEAALALRRERFATMPEGASAYERGIERSEGLAQYVEHMSIGEKFALDEKDFPAEQVRQRGYATGEALTLLLDRFGEWKTALDGTSLDALLQARLPSDGEPCSVGEKQRREATQHAKREVAEVVAGRDKRRADFLGAKGWRLEIVAGAEPLWPQGFDPLNVANLGGTFVLHTRWTKMGNGAGTLEVLDRAALTEGVGPHPLFNGAKVVTVTGLPEPKVVEADGRWTIEAAGAKGTFQGRVEREGTRILVLLGTGS